MRWVVKASLDGRYCDDVLCVGTPLVPESGAHVLLPRDGYYQPGVVSEARIDKSRVPAVLRIICLSPGAFAKN